MNKEIISLEDYEKLSKRTNWKVSKRRYKEEFGLEDVCMEKDEFNQIEGIIMNRPALFKFVCDLVKHGSRYSLVKTKEKTGYFNALNVLNDLGIIINNKRSFSDKGRAFLLEYGRRNYDSDD